PHSPHRALRNSLTDGGSPPPGSVARVRLGDQTVEVPPFRSATPTVHTEGRTELMANYAGQGVGLIHNILPAAEIVEQMIAEPEELGNGGRVQWVSGRPGEPPAYAGTDFIIVRDGRISALYLFFDKLP